MRLPAWQQGNGRWAMGQWGDEQWGNGAVRKWCSSSDVVRQHWRGVGVCKEEVDERFLGVMTLWNSEA
jgi:hypothetical protein